MPTGSGRIGRAIDLTLDIIFLLDILLRFNTMAEVVMRRRAHGIASNGIYFNYWTTSHVEIATK